MKTSVLDVEDSAEPQTNGGVERIDILESAELRAGEESTTKKSVRFKLIKSGLRMFKQQQQHQLDSTELPRIHENGGSLQLLQVLWHFGFFKMRSEMLSFRVIAFKKTDFI